jgi:uracil phosphoribosyltransferase
MVVDHLREAYGARVTAFGDSPIDLYMLQRADQAVGVVGSEETRSKTMPNELRATIANTDLPNAVQAILHPGAPPVVDTKMLPEVKLLDKDFLDAIINTRLPCPSMQVITQTDTGAARVLMTSMRDSNVSGVALRKAHHNVGWYLATENLPEVLGLEELSITHVQGGSTQGHRVESENQILIIALMRGGEPMAFGVNEALPSAQLLHAKKPEDVTSAHLSGRSAVILVDSVINSGGTIMDFVEWIHETNPKIPLVAMTGVLQEDAVKKLKDFHQGLPAYQPFTLVALRISKKKYTGKGGTDTGHRLFNTTYLD